MNYKKESDSNSNFTNNYLGDLLKNKLRNYIKSEERIQLRDAVTMKGSIGQTKWAEIPWFKIASSIKNVHESTQKGCYLVYLFDAEMKGVYISLNQGWTYYKKRYGTKLGLEKAITTSHLIFEELQLNEKNFSRNINLKSKAIIPRGYEACHIIGKYYPLAEFPSNDELINDLNEFLLVYQKLSELIGINRDYKDYTELLLLEKNDSYIELKEKTYQEAINFENQKPSEINDDFKIRKDFVTNRQGVKQYPRDKNMGIIALKKANYQCEFNTNFPTFINNVTGENYMEAHHLVPIEYAEQFEYDIDQPANIISLNPISHRMIHFATDDKKSEMIDYFYNLRSEGLKKQGISISLDQLKKCMEYRKTCNRSVISPFLITRALY